MRMWIQVTFHRSDWLRNRTQVLARSVWRVLHVLWLDVDALVSECLLCSSPLVDIS